MNTAFRILEGEELLAPSDHPYVALAARQWAWIGCTCEPIGFVAHELDDGSLRVSVVHDENCPTLGTATAFSESRREGLL